MTFTIQNKILTVLKYKNESVGIYNFNINKNRDIIQNVINRIEYNTIYNHRIQNLIILKFRKKNYYIKENLYSILYNNNNKGRE